MCVFLFVRRLGFVVLLFAALLANASASLTLQEVERVALEADPTIAAGLARSSALHEGSVADGQLPDPKLTLGMFNVPVDSFDVEDEPTTQLRFGVHQAFPRGNTRRFTQRRTAWKAAVEDALVRNVEQHTVRTVREAFLELYYLVRAGEIINETRGLFAQLVKITQAHYGSGRVRQQDVLRANLELSRLDDRETRIRGQEDMSRATLSRWIGELAWGGVDDAFPFLPEPGNQSALVTGLQQHPLMVAQSAKVESEQQSVNIAQEQYKPGWSVGMEYRKRFGEDPSGSDRDDMMAAMVTVDLPLFRDKRQDRRLAASQQQAQAARFDRTDQLRALKEMLDREFVNWRRLGERQDLYELQLLREARANATASVKAYRSGVTEFTTLMRARITELDVRLDDLRVRVDRAKAQARLLYLSAGESQ